MAEEAAYSPIKVLVTGASGKTGALIVQEMLKLPDKFQVCVVVRSEKAHKLMLDLGVTPANIFELDIAGNTEETVAALKVAMQGCQALVICTSAVPEVQMLPTLLGGLRMWLSSMMPRIGRRQGAQGDSSDLPFVPVARWKGGQTPEEVDWQGQLAQITAARAAGVQHIVMVSSAGGCNPKHFLNYIGDGDILNWKRLAEQHLIASGVTYTILHPNHLVDLPGHHEILLSVDDGLQKPHWRQRHKMPRGDLAFLAVQALLLQDQGAGNRSIDCAARVPAAGSQPTTAAEQVKQLLQEMKDNCDYSINDRTKPDAVWACRKT